MIRSLLLAVLIVAPVMAQEAAKEAPPPAKPPEAQKSERRSLNLKLDNPASFATITSPDKDAAKLPTLGGDARPINPGGANAPPRDPIPKDTNPAAR